MGVSFPKPPKDARVIFRQELNGMPDGRVIPVPMFAANEAGYRWLSKYFAFLASTVGASRYENHVHFATDEPPFDPSFSDEVEFKFASIEENAAGVVNDWIFSDNRETGCASERYLELARRAKWMRDNVTPSS